MKLIFDFDGTLHISECTYIPAFHKVRAYLAEAGVSPAHELSDDEVGYWLGYSSKEMWEHFLPAQPELQETCSGILHEEMLQRAKDGKARLYPGVESALSRLKEEGHTLVFFSNCHHDYMTVHAAAFHLERWFDAFFCGEDLGWKPKTEGFEDICARYGVTRDLAREFIVIGDRFHDISIARDHGLASVGCAYGYGEPSELADASVIVNDPADLLDAIEQVIASVQAAS